MNHEQAITPLRRQRDNGNHARSSRDRLNSQMPSNLVDALAHAVQSDANSCGSQVPPPGAPPRHPNPRIRYDELDFRLNTDGLAYDLNFGSLATGMTGYIGERFLHDAIEDKLGIGRQARKVGGDTEFDTDTGSLAELFGISGQSPRQSTLAE